MSEALFRARLSPRRLAATVTGARADRLLAALRAVLNDAIAAGGSTLRDYARADGELGYFQHVFAVYDREGLACPGCTCGAPPPPAGRPDGPPEDASDDPGAARLSASARAGLNAARQARTAVRGDAGPVRGIRRIVQSGRSTFYCPRRQR